MDLTPATFADGSEADQLRYLKQQYAAAVKAKSLRSADGRELVRHNLPELEAAIQRLERKLDTRGGIVYTARACR